MINSLSSSDFFEDVPHFIRVIRRHQYGDRAAFDFFGQVAIDPLGAAVPTGDDPLQSLPDDGVIRRFHNCG